MAQRLLQPAFQVQPPGLQGLTQQQGAGLPGEFDILVVVVRRSRLQGNEQPQGRNILVEDEVAVAAQAAQIVGLRAIRRRFAQFPALELAAAAQRQAGRLPRPQQVHQMLRQALAFRRGGKRPGRRQRSLIQRIQHIEPVQGLLAGFGKSFRLLRQLSACRRALREPLGRLPLQRQQHRNHMLAVHADRAGAIVIHPLERAVRGKRQPQVDPVRFARRPLYRGLGMDFLRRALDLFDRDPPRIGIVLATLHGQRAEFVFQLGQMLGGQGKAVRHDRCPGTREAGLGRYHSPPFAVSSAPTFSGRCRVVVDVQ